MNKMIMTALVLVASASLFTASAAGKGKKKDKAKKPAASAVGFSFRLVELCCRNESKQSGFDTLSSAGLSG